VARRRKPAHLVLIHGRGRFSFDRPPPELLAARWVGRLERALHKAGEPGLSQQLSGVTFLDYMSLLAPYSRAYRKRLEADLEAVAARMADESREDDDSDQADENGDSDDDVPAPKPGSTGISPEELEADQEELAEEPEPEPLATRYCPDCTGKYADSALGEPRRRLRHLGRRLTEPFGVERIAWVFPDAVAYLANERLRADIHDLLAYRLPKKKGTPVIVVAHSLGSVIAADLWAELGEQYRTRLFLTAGSPLAVPLVRRRLHPRTADWVRDLPDGFPWVNVIDPVDPVTLARELRPPYFDPSVANLEVENGRRFHSEDRYLSHIAVAREVVKAAR
jgi:hypothetical protein